MSSAAPVRSIVCVDGTWCDPDGAHGTRNNNITNIYRLCTSIKTGECVDSTGKSYHQKKKYFRGIASEDGLSYSGRLMAGMLGNQTIDQIRDVYQYCCLTTGKDDEVWLFGFSRGAFVIRAVAGLLHYIGALKSAGEDSFKDDFKQALKVYKTLQQQNKLGVGQIHEMLVTSTRPAPIIKFVGAFDTVKAVQDENLYDIRFNPSIQHFRHALALNEDRRRFEPEYLFPDFNNRNQNLKQRSFIQAWFVGAHIDIGGSTSKDGLSLYPLQWMLLESRACGLCLKFDGSVGNRVQLADPLQLTGLEGAGDAWMCSTENGINVEMRDIRGVHDDPVHKGRYAVHLHRASSVLWIRRHREPFGSDGDLNGYCSFGPQGTIIHPSAYLILDRFMYVSLDAKHFPFHQFLHTWRAKILGQKDDLLNGCFWNDAPSLAEVEEPGAIRILVCGNTGVGKSSLINKVFGVDCTPVSERTRGTHQIDEPITWEGRPDLVVHDSNGFEAGGEDELEAVEKFLRNKSSETQVDQRLHVIWYCLEIGTPRPKQTAHERLFRTLSEHGQDIPIVVIATKKDIFLATKEREGKRDLKKRNKPYDEEIVAAYASQKLEERLLELSDELREQAHFDSLVAVSTEDGDEDSIGDLSMATTQLFDHERVRLMYIRAQATRLDMKIELAETAAIKIYKKVLISTSALTAVPGGLSTNRAAAAVDVCRAIITSFGLTTITAETVIQICMANLWDDMGNNIRTTIAELAAAVGMGFSIVTGLPFFLIPMATNFPLAVVATSRLLVMLSCDVILILTRAFRQAAAKSITKPEKRDVEIAALEYRQHCHDVHRDIKTELSHVGRCYKPSCYEVLIPAIIKKYTGRVLEGTGASLPPNFKRQYADADAKSLSTLYDDDAGSSCGKTEG